MDITNNTTSSYFHANTQDETNTSCKAHYQPEITGLRALAIIAVIINHINNQWLQSGYLGVDIFFVISGYVITKMLSGYSFTSAKAFVFEFYSKRIKRLAPGLITCTLITCLVISIIAPGQSTSLKTGVTSLLGFSNFYIYHLGTNYFDTASKYNAFTHTWSLAVEEQFYLFYPILAWFLGYVSVKKQQTNNKLLVFLIVISFLSFVYFAIVH